MEQPKKKADSKKDKLSKEEISRRDALRKMALTSLGAVAAVYGVSTISGCSKPEPYYDSYYINYTDIYYYYNSYTDIYYYYY
jgi:hypothetical protein